MWAAAAKCAGQTKQQAAHSATQRPCLHAPAPVRRPRSVAEAGQFPTGTNPAGRSCVQPPSHPPTPAQYRQFRTNMALDVNCTCNFSPPLYVASASCQSGIYGIPSGKDGGMVRTVETCYLPVRYYQHFTLRLQVNYLAFTRKIYGAHATRCHICPKMTVLRSRTAHTHAAAPLVDYNCTAGIRKYTGTYHTYSCSMRPDTVGGVVVATICTTS